MEKVNLTAQDLNSINCSLAQAQEITNMPKDDKNRLIRLRKKIHIILSQIEIKVKK